MPSKSKTSEQFDVNKVLPLHIPFSQLMQMVCSHVFHSDYCSEMSCFFRLLDQINVCIVWFGSDNHLLLLDFFFWFHRLFVMPSVWMCIDCVFRLILFQINGIICFNTFYSTIWFEHRKTKQNTHIHTHTHSNHDLCERVWIQCMQSLFVLFHFIFIYTFECNSNFG